MPGLKTLALTVAVRGGARWENETQSGWSHLLEHLVFKGAGDMGARDIVERIEAEGGTINAATGYERTSFEVRALDGSLGLAMQVVSDLGSVESLKPVTRESIGDWRARLYSPDRMVVAVSGAVDEAELLELAERWFGSAVATPVGTPEPATFIGGAATLGRKIEQANIVFQLPSVSATDPDLPAMRLFTEILGGGMASRLFQSAREERGLAYAIDAYQEAYEDAGVLGVYAGAAADRAVELAGVCADEIKALATEGPTDAELSRARAVLTAGLWMSDESPASRAGRNAAQTLIYGAPVSSDDSAKRIVAVTADDLRRVGQRVLASGLSATSVLGPKAAHAAGTAFAKGLAG
jgi:predicted Zn-dependent peptidase